MSGLETRRLPRAVPAEMLQALDARDLVKGENDGWRRWHWKYVENPQGTEAGLPAWVAVSDGELIGHLGAIPVKLKVNAAVLDGAWAIDFMARAGERRKGIGAALLEDATKSWDIFLTAGQTDASFGLFVKMGWQYLGDLPYFIKILDARTVLGDRVGRGPIGALANLGLRLLSGRGRLDPGISISPIDEFTDEADSFWRDIADGYRVVVPRDQAYLNWKYVTQPEMNYVRFRAARHGRVCGYAVVRAVQSGLGRPAGLIADVLAHRDDQAVRRALLQAAVGYCEAAHCGLVRCLASHESLQKSLRALGFMRRRSAKVRMVSKDPGGLANSIGLSEWYLTAGDCDIDR